MGQPNKSQYWLLRENPLPIVAKVELQARKGDQLGVTEKVVAQLHTADGFDLQAFIPKNIQGTQAGCDIALLETLDILVRALMEMLTAGAPQRSLHRFDRF